MSTKTGAFLPFGVSEKSGQFSEFFWQPDEFFGETRTFFGFLTINPGNGLHFVGKYDIIEGTSQERTSQERTSQERTSRGLLCDAQQAFLQNSMIYRVLEESYDKF